MAISKWRCYDVDKKPFSSIICGLETIAEMFLPENIVCLWEFKKVYTLGVWSEQDLSILDLGVSAGALPEAAKGLAFFTLVPPAAGGRTSAADSLLSSTTATG